MKNLRPILLLLTILVYFTGCNRSINVLLIVGGHSFDTTEFFDMFHSLEGIRFEPVYHPDAMDVLKSDLAEPYDVLVFYDFIPDMPPEDSAVFLELARQGKSMLFLHHSICSFQEWEGYKQLVGGRYVMPEYNPDSATWSDYQHGIDMDIQVLNRDHPITRGLHDFQIHDEGYSNLMVLEDVTPLIGTGHPACSPLVGWSGSMNNSTTVYLIFGHDKHAYQNTSFRHLLSNALSWLAEQD